MNASIADLEGEIGRRGEETRANRDEIARLSAEGDELRGKLEGRDRQVIQLLAELNATRERVEVEMRSLAILARRLEEMEVTSRGAATRIRLAALREAAEIAGASKGAGGDHAMEAIERAVERVAGGWEPEEEEPEARDEIAVHRTISVAEEDVVAELRRIEPKVDPLPSGQLAGRAGRSISVDIGPFDDFSQLVRFEDAANAIGETGDISIKRFSGGRARIDVSLSEPIDLLRELESRCELDFVVRSQSDAEIVLDVEN